VTSESPAQLDAGQERTPPSTGRRLWRLVKLGVAIGLLAVIIWRVDWQEVVVLSSRVYVGWLALMLLVSILDRFWMAAKWHYLVRGLGVSVRFPETAYTYYLGLLGGLAAQSQLGGDILRAVRLARQSGQRRLVVASVVYEKLAGFATCGVLAGGSLALLNQRHHVLDWWMAGPLLALTVAILTALPLLVFSRLGLRCLAWLVRSRPRLSERLGLDTEQAARRLWDVRRASRVFVALTMAEQFVPLFTNSLLQWSLGLDVGFIRTASVVPIIIFASRLPVSIDGLGVYEGMSVVLFGLMGLTVAEGFSLALAGRLAGIASTLAGAGFFFALTRRSVSPAPGAPAAVNDPNPRDPHVHVPSAERPR